MKSLSLSLISLIVCFQLVNVMSASEMYSNKQLAKDSKRYAQKIEFLFKKGLRYFMTPEEKSAVQDVFIQYPIRDNSPISFTRIEIEGTPVIRAPILSLKFIEDLTVVYAWRYVHKYSLEPIDLYLTMLKHRKPSDFSQGSDPMTVLGVPEKIWERESAVDDLSLRFRNSAWAFILAHELGHVRFKHASNNVSPSMIQRQEEEADQFAVELLDRSDTIPMGMILWFQATAGYMRNSSDFQTDSDYFKWLSTDAKHPVNGSRMKKLASSMRKIAALHEPKQAQVLLYIANRLESIGKTIEDPQMQQLLKKCTTLWHPGDLKKLYDVSCKNIQ